MEYVPALNPGKPTVEVLMLNVIVAPAEASGLAEPEVVSAPILLVKLPPNTVLPF